jgi:hypothetical protein
MYPSLSTASPFSFGHRGAAAPSEATMRSTGGDYASLDPRILFDRKDILLCQFTPRQYGGPASEIIKQASPPGYQRDTRVPTGETPAQGEGQFHPARTAASHHYVPGYIARNALPLGQPRKEAADRPDVDDPWIHAENSLGSPHAADIDRTDVETDRSAIARGDRPLLRIDRGAAVEDQFDPRPPGKRHEIDASMFIIIFARNRSRDHTRIPRVAMWRNQCCACLGTAAAHPIGQHPEMRMPATDEHEFGSGRPHPLGGCGSRL